MENDLTLVVMAAGMGSRFGGLKQLEPVDEDGNFLLDYSVYDAIRAGFRKVVFVIKEELLEDFKNTVGKRLEGKIEVFYAFQRLEDVPYSDIEKLKERSKPWGTSQAILTTKPYVHGPFAVINADDFYGASAYKQISEFFKLNYADNNFVSVLYPFCETRSSNLAVKRGVCKIVNDKVMDIKECSVEGELGKLIASPLDGSLPFKIEDNALVSMNIFGFTNKIYSLLEGQMNEFFSLGLDKILKGEVLLPSCLEKNLKDGNIVIHKEISNDKWIGMTYRDDLPFVKEEILSLKEKGAYPQHLWK